MQTRGKSEFNSRVIGFAATVLALGGLSLFGECQAQAQTPTSGDAATYSLRPVWKVGETTRYKMSVHRISDGKKRADLDVQDSLFHIILLETTRDVQPNGTTVVEDNTEQADGNFDGIEMDLTSAIPKMTLTRDKTGEATVKAEGGVDLVREPLTQLFRLTARMQRGFRPPAPVKMGETWKFTWQDTGAVEGKTDGKGTLIGPGVLNGQPILKVKVEYDSKVKATNPRTGDKIDVVFHFTGAADIDAKNFQIAQLTGNGEEHLTNDEIAKTEVSLTRLPAKDAKEQKSKVEKETGTAKDTK